MGAFGGSSAAFGDVPGGGFPYGGVANLFFNLIPGFINQFSGQPRGAVTQEAIARLLGANAPPAIKSVLTQFGLTLFKLFESGTVLSTSTGPGRKSLNDAFVNAVNGLVQQGYTRKDAFNVLTGFLQGKQTFLPGTTLGEIVALPTGPPVVSSFGPPTRAQTVVNQPPSPPPEGPTGLFPPSGPSSGQSFADQFLSITPQKVAALSAGVALLAGQPELAIPLAAKGLQFGEELKLGENVLRDIFGPPPPSLADLRRQLTSPPPPPGQQDIIDPRDCPQCNPEQAALRARLKAQEGTLRDELRTEQQQQQGKQLTQQQKTIDDLRRLEQQPVDQRDIPREIQQKVALLEQIGNELQQLQQQIDNPGQPPLAGPPPGGEVFNPFPPPSGGPIEPIGPPPPPPGQLSQEEHVREEEQIFIQQEPTGAAGDPTKAVKFCVGCVTQDDALKFLNGEPSACSVMPFPS